MMKRRTVYYHEASRSLYMAGFARCRDVAQWTSWGCIPLHNNREILRRYHETKKSRYFFGSEQVSKRTWASLMGIPVKFRCKPKPKPVITPPVPVTPTPPAPTVIVTTRPEDWRNRYLTPGQRKRLQPT